MPKQKLTGSVCCIGVNTYEAELQLMGAPNFRSTNLSIFGAAQPTSTGLATILRVLQCGAGQNASKKTLWFSTREEPIVYINDNPYVLRDVSNPFVNIKSYSGISAGRLESVEKRLKNDIANEAKRNAGLLLVHDERGTCQARQTQETWKSGNTNTF
jgi:hypothetical protein